MMALRPILFALAALLSMALAGPASAQQPAPNPRIALVVGEQTYPDQALATTANDAGLIAQTLQAAGFDVVGARDLDAQSLRTALRDFLDKAGEAGPDLQAFVYLAGRGVQYAGDNYFVPTDATIRRDVDVPIEAIRVGDFLHALATLPGRARIVVLDAARGGPYAAQGAPLAPGLALMDAEPGVLIAFNASPGTLAGDEQGPYGVYGKTLAGALRQGGLDIAEAFDQTRVLVNQETQGALLPWSVSKLGEPYYVFERAADAPPPPVAAAMEERRQPIGRYPADDAYAVALQRDTIAGYREFLAAYPRSAQARRVRAILAARREAAFWRRARDANSPRAYWTYLHAYPTGPHVADARRRLAFLSAAYQPPTDFEPIEFAGLPPPPPDEIFYVERPVYAFDDLGPPPPPPPSIYGLEDDDDWRVLPPPPPPPAVGVLPVLGVAIPVIAGAVAYQGHRPWRHDGVAPAGAPTLAPRPPAPPPLPAGVKPVAPPPPRPIASTGAAPHGPVVRPLPPIATRPARGTAPSGAANSPPVQPNNPAPAPAAPQQKPGALGEAAKPQPSPPPSTAGGVPAAPSAVKPPATPLPAGAAGPSNNPAANPSATKPRPAPAPGVAPAAPSGGKPLPTPSASSRKVPTPALTKPAAPEAGKPNIEPAKPLPAAPAPGAANGQAPAPAARPTPPPSEVRPATPAEEKRGAAPNASPATPAPGGAHTLAPAIKPQPPAPPSAAVAPPKPTLNSTGESQKPRPSVAIPEAGPSEQKPQPPHPPAPGSPPAAHPARAPAAPAIRAPVLLAPPVAPAMHAPAPPTPAPAAPQIQIAHPPAAPAPLVHPPQTAGPAHPARAPQGPQLVRPPGQSPRSTPGHAQPGPGQPLQQQ